MSTFQDVSHIHNFKFCSEKVLMWAFENPLHTPTGLRAPCRCCMGALLLAQAEIDANLMS